MDNPLSYNSKEIFRAAEMDSRGFYLVVEGEYDVPVFSELLSFYKAQGRLNMSPLIGAGGGKPNILSWLGSKPEVNVKVVLDRDFDDISTELNDPRIIPLNVYSIENYYFNNSVIKPLMAHLTGSSVDEVERWLDTDTLFEHWAQMLTTTISILYYYQKEYGGEKNGWGERDIVENRERWTLCPNKIQRFNDAILQQMEVEIDDCARYFYDNFPYNECISMIFPGKILQKSLFRYLKDICTQQGGDFSSITNVGQLFQSLTPRLIYNRNLVDVVDRLTA